MISVAILLGTTQNTHTHTEALVTLLKHTPNLSILIPIFTFLPNIHINLSNNSIFTCTMQVDIEKLAIFAIFLIFRVEKKEKYTSDSYKSIVFQVPLTEPYTLIPEFLRSKCFQSFPEQKIRQITTGSGLGSLAHMYVCSMAPSNSFASPVSFHVS